MLGIYVLFILAYILINPPTTNNQTKLDAALLITMEWTDNSPDDVDLWVSIPGSTVPIYYRNREVNLASLDRDDVGTKRETVKLNDGTSLTYPRNVEHVTVRKAPDGHYIINVVMFAKNTIAPTTVQLKVEMLQPYRIIYLGNIILTRATQEETAIQFDIVDGKVQNRNQLPHSLIIQ